jgi:hypothetical protein
LFRWEETGFAVETVRYGRARLTVARSTPPRDLVGLGEVVEAYGRGQARATSVAAAFLRQRVVDHSPSFDWRSARLMELLPIVCALSDEPKLHASTPAELADELLGTRPDALGHTARNGRLPLKLIPRSWRGRIATRTAVAQPGSRS